MAKTTRKTSSSPSAKKRTTAAKRKKGAAPAEAPETPEKDDRTVAERQSALLEALREALGIALFACKRAEVSYDEYLEWRREDPEFARQVTLIDERALDFVEGKAFEEIRNGNARLIQFFLETKGRGRGYAKEPPEKPRKKAPSPLEFLSPEEMEY